MMPNGTRVYEAVKPNTGDINIRINFPAIREGDLPLLIKAVAEAMTLDNKSGQVVGIDEKVGVRLLFDLLAGTMNIPDIDEIVDKMYPKKIHGVPGKPGYDPNRTVAPLAPPIPKAQPLPGGVPQPTPAQAAQPPAPAPAAPPAKAAEALTNLLGALQSLKESRTNGHA
jgi:hypothetical protein